MGSSWQRLSHGQEGLWFLWKLVPDAYAFHNVLPVRVRGPLDVEALRRSVDALSARHPSLRMELREENGTPLQRPGAADACSLKVVDATAWTEAELEAALLDTARRPFVLDGDASARVVLFRTAPDRSLFVLTAHHIISDLWSVIVFMDELRALYAAERSGSAATLPPLPVAYTDFVEERRLALDGEGGEALWRYWRDELSGDVPALDLPADHPRPAMQSYRGGTFLQRLDAELMGRFKRLAGQERVTVFMAFLAAYQAFLHRYTGQESFVVGSPTAGRDRGELQGVIGDFINMVPIRADLSGEPSFRELLARVRARLLATIRHQEYPFSSIVDRLHLTRDLSRAPVFQTTLVLQTFQRYREISRAVLPEGNEEPIPFADLLLEPVPLAQQDGQFDLNLEIKEDEQGRFAVAWKYAADLFEVSTIERMAGHFETLLAELIAGPERPIAALRLMSEAETEATIAAGNGPVRELPAASSVCELFAAQARRTPSSVAVECEGRSLTYAALDARVTALARHLVALGCGRDTIVAVLLPRGIDFVTALLAIARAGGAFLPLDARHPPARALQVLQGSGAPLVLTCDALAVTLPEEAARITRIVSIESLEGPPPGVPLPAVAPESLAYLMYTSGSTGAPKGVMVEHRGMINHVLAKLGDLGMTAQDVLAQNGPPTFDIVVWQCLAPLVNGGRVLVFPDDVAEDPGRLLAEVDERGVTVLQCVPSMLHALLDEVSERSRPRLRALRWMVPTGEALPTELCRRWLELYPHIPVLNTYGSTECSDDQCHYAIHALDSADAAVPVVSIGTPISNMSAYVLDRSLTPVPPGVVGELYIGGIGVGRGYYRDDARTASAFVPDPFRAEPGARLYRTRDFARRRPDGRLDFLGRADNTIKLRGLRIEPGDIEAALQQHDAVAQAAVVAQRPPAGEKVLTAYVVPANGARPEPHELRHFLAARLPQAMVPSLFLFIDALPLTANGKLDMHGLPAPQWDAASREELVAPRTPTEERIAAIWADVLGVGRVGVTQDFFAIGGDSIRSIQIVARCQRAGIALRPSDLFQHSTVAALAILAGRQAAPAEETVPLPALEVGDDELALALAQVTFDS